MGPVSSVGPLGGTRCHCPVIDAVNLVMVKGTTPWDKKSLNSVNRKRQTGARGPVWQAVCLALRVSQAPGRLDAARERAGCSLPSGYLYAKQRPGSATVDLLIALLRMTPGFGRAAGVQQILPWHLH